MSEYLGVLKVEKPWKAVVDVRGSLRLIGTYKTEAEAALHYNIYVLRTD